MNISMIAAIGKNRELGYRNELLWHISADFKRFKSITTGHTVVMGLRTYESIGSRPLPNRRNIILTDRPLETEPIVLQAGSVDEVLKMIDPEGETFIMGGASVYKQFLPLSQKLYLTLVHKEYLADTWFPEIEMDDWEVIEQTKVTGDEKAGVDYTYLTLRRK
jgi:dihydrofolate reductase